MLTVKISEFITKRILYYLINSVYKQGIQNSLSSRRINKTKSDVNRDFTSGQLPFKPTFHGGNLISKPYSLLCFAEHAP